MRVLRNFGGSLGVGVAGLAVAGAYAGLPGVTVALILAALECSLSFDNAVVNAGVLTRMSRVWRMVFLTVGIAIAVFGTRLLLPVLIVAITAGHDPASVVRLALRGGSPQEPGTYGYLVDQAHPAICAFGGAFLLALFLDFMCQRHDVTWLTWLERALQRLGASRLLPAAAATGASVLAALLTPDRAQVLPAIGAALVGIATFWLLRFVSGSLAGASTTRATRRAATRAAWGLFLYLEVLDASFSLDGVVGAFAVSSDPVLIAIGLGIGAMFTRSLTVLLVRNGTLVRYQFLEHGAMWAIGALGAVMLLSISLKVPGILAGGTGAVLIGAALLSSLRISPAEADPVEVA